MYLATPQIQLPAIQTNEMATYLHCLIACQTVGDKSFLGSEAAEGVSQRRKGIWQAAVCFMTSAAH